MPMLKKRRSREVEIPTASMADIAFLLLIFFLVTTTIDVDTGIGMTLPPKPDETTPPPPVQDRNMLAILVNANGQVLLENEYSDLNNIRREVITHLTNNGQNPNYADSPDKAVVSIKTQRQTRYKAYIDVLDEVWMGYREVWDQEARRRGFADYATYRAQLSDPSENEIRQTFPAQVSIAEPDSEGEATTP